MECVFYKNKSDNIVVDKDIERILSKEITLKDDTSVIKPTIILSYDERILSCNYLYMMNRFYFITNITCSNQRLIIDCDCDELFTYRSQIKNSKAIIKRQEQRKNVNTYLDDDKYKCYEYSRIQTLPFTRGFTDEEFILAVSGF